MRSAPILLVALLALSGCAHYPGGIAPSTVPLAPGGYTVVRPYVMGQDCLVALFGIIPLTGGNTTAAAVQSALSRAPGSDALVNVTSDAYSQFWILWSSTCTQVRGTAVKVN
jgi:hypothetical protein